MALTVVDSVEDELIDGDVDRVVVVVRLMDCVLVASGEAEGFEAVADDDVVMDSSLDMLELPRSLDNERE